MNRNRRLIGRITILLIFLAGVVPWTTAQEGAPLVRAEEPTPEQRQRWREALEWPSHCGGRERDAADQPVLGFLDAGDGRYLVYSVCASNSYRSEVNLFLVETDRPHVKPRLLTLKILEPIYAPDPDPDAGRVDSDALWEEVLSVAKKMQERVGYQARTTSLVEGRFSVDDRGRLVVDKRNNGPGTCGTHSLYDLDRNPPRLVGFRAQFRCFGSSEVADWAAYSQEYIDNVPLVSTPIPPLVRADELTVEQRQRWREALQWPTHCRDGLYTWDNEDYPSPEFLDISDDRYLVYNICEMGAYQRAVNAFVVETDRPHVKPRLLTFKLLEPACNPTSNPDPDSYPDPDFSMPDLINAPEEARIRFAREEQEAVEYEAKTTSLPWVWYFYADDQGRLILDRVYNGVGTCGTYSTYDLDYDPPRLVGFRGQYECLGSSDMDTWKSYSQDYLDSVPLSSAPAWPPALAITDHLTYKQRLRWREALQWPTHCEDGITPWEADGRHPILEFLDMGDGRYLVYNYCEYVNYARNTAFNLFLVDTDRPEVKPRLLSLKVLELVDNPDSDPGAVGGERFEARMTALIERWPLSVDDQGRLVIEKTIDSSGSGICKTLSIYDLDRNPPRLVGLRAQYQCFDDDGYMADTKYWRSYSPQYIDSIPLVSAPTPTARLVRAEVLTPEQRRRWREALEWPTHCRGGNYQGDDDEDQPALGFLDAGDGRYLVYNVCSWDPSEVNLFLVDANRPDVKPRLLTFKVLGPAYNPDPDIEHKEIDYWSEERIQYALELQEKVEYEAEMTSLIRGGFLVDDQGRLVLERRRRWFTGYCGTSSIYDLDQDPPRLIGFRAQYECIGSSDITRWKSYSQDYLDSVPVVSE